MESALQYKNKQIKRLVINISDDASFNKIIKQLELIDFPISEQKMEQVRFALLELINNSVRAHRELDTKEKIKIIYQFKQNFIMIILEDHGGGFDISDLPYDLSSNINDIDLENSDFQQYREKYNYKRFGMGLLSAKKVFDKFSFCFYDIDGNVIEYSKKNVIGTRFNLEVKISE